jgi:hypothetical protein
MISDVKWKADDGVGNALVFFARGQYTPVGV